VSLCRRDRGAKAVPSRRSHHRSASRSSAFRSGPVAAATFGKRGGERHSGVDTAGLRESRLQNCAAPGAVWGAPSTVIDRADLSPHNAARHGLTPASGPMQLPWMGSKAKALADAIEGLGQQADAIARDVIDIVCDKERLRRVLKRKAWAVVNS